MPCGHTRSVLTHDGMTLGLGHNCAHTNSASSNHELVWRCTSRCASPYPRAQPSKPYLLPRVTTFVALRFLLLRFKQQQQHPSPSLRALARSSPMAAVPSVLLNSGARIPAIGLGVYKSGPGEETYSAVLSALKLGYRHIDTAQFYQNEADVGRAVRDSGVPRAEVFVTTKLWRSEWGYERATAAIEGSVKRLGLDYVDLMLLHCPGDPSTRAETWRALEDAVNKGSLKSIGVSNFGIPHLEKLFSTCSIRPAVNQIELHPFLQWRDVVDYCKAQGIVLEAYSPLVKAEKLGDPRLTSLASRKGVTTAQLLLRWSLQKDFVTLPKSVNPERQAQNLDVFGFELSAQEVAELDTLEEGLVTGWNPIKDDAV